MGLEFGGSDKGALGLDVTGRGDASQGDASVWGLGGCVSARAISSEGDYTARVVGAGWDGNQEFHFKIPSISGGDPEGGRGCT